jgi:hypothetical protein
MSRYDELEMACLVDAVDRANSAAELEGDHVSDILQELSHVLDLLQESSASLACQFLSRDAKGLRSHDEELAEAHNRLDTFLEMVDETSMSADGDRLGNWLDERVNRELVFVPEGMDRDWAMRVLEKAAPNPE